MVVVLHIAEVLYFLVITQCWLAVTIQITGVVQTTINTMVAPAWKQIQSTTETVGSKVEPIIRQGTEPIFKLKTEAKEKIRGKLNYNGNKP